MADKFPVVDSKDLFQVVGEASFVEDAEGNVDLKVVWFGVPCEWFAKCDHVTTKGSAHPILGLVPCCERCSEQVGGLDLVDLPAL